jgi:PAS domain-containing protein
MPLDERLLELIDRVHADSPNPVVGVLPDLTVCYANQAAAREAGVETEALIGTVCHESLLDSSVPCPGCLAREVFRDATARSRTRHTSGPSGSERWVVERWQPIVDDAGAVACVLRASYDETQSRLAALEAGPTADIRAERDRMQQFLDATAAVIMTVDDDGTVTRINRTGTEILGRTTGEIVGKNWLEEFVPLEQRDE